eukprot:UN04358
MIKQQTAITKKIMYILRTTHDFLLLLLFFCKTYKHSISPTFFTLYFIAIITQHQALLSPFFSSQIYLKQQQQHTPNNTTLFSFIIQKKQDKIIIIIIWF